MTFSQAQEALYALSSSPRVDPEIYTHRVYNLLQQQGFSPDRLSYIHVAGSKGKGSLSRTAFRLLSLEKIKTGLFISPHILDICERIETWNGAIPKSDFIRITQQFSPLFQQEQLHFFEALLFMAIVFFLEQGCTHAVLEVGVGGRFDPTNFCHPKLILMAHISMEHREFLGGSLKAIAWNKAGVLKSGCPIWSVTQQDFIKNILEEEKKAIVFANDAIQVKNTQRKPWGTVFDMTISHNEKVINYNRVPLHRLGAAALENFLLAVAGIWSILPSLGQQTIMQVAQEEIPYRLQLLTDFILADTAHNGQSFFNLCDTVEKWLTWSEVTLYISLLEGKEYQDIANVLRRYSHLWKSIKVFDFISGTMRSSNGKEFFSLLEGLPVEYVGILPLDYKFESNTPIVWAGSFYSISRIQTILINSKLSLGKM
ncbi:MAG: hypothetical protein ACRC9L_09725 [Brevinema sp.]